jgi:hypothetical protein
MSFCWRYYLAIHCFLQLLMDYYVYITRDCIITIFEPAKGPNAATVAVNRHSPLSFAIEFTTVAAPRRNPDQADIMQAGKMKGFQAP